LSYRDIFLHIRNGFFSLDLTEIKRFNTDKWCFINA
jgi:hypothetical protein